MRQQVLAKGYAGGTPLAIKNQSICKIQPYLLSCNILEKFIKLFSTKKTVAEHKILQQFFNFFKKLLLLIQHFLQRLQNHRHFRQLQHVDPNV